LEDGVAVLVEELVMGICVEAAVGDGRLKVKFESCCGRVCGGLGIQFGFQKSSNIIFEKGGPSGVEGNCGAVVGEESSVCCCLHNIIYGE